MSDENFGELGIPDLTLVTIRQMADELKRRKNVCFGLVWIQESSKDNISIEGGGGDPTKIVGLLARGTQMAIDWADRDMRFRDK